MARACLEGVAAELADCLELVRDAAQLPPFAGVRCAGGLLRSALFSQILADTSGTALSAFSREESTTRGLWMVAAVRLGLFPGLADAFAAATREEGIRSFKPDAALRDVYARASAERRAVYDCMADRRAGSGRGGADG
jgi:sugar (pentulose or hexulose) kinase